MGKKYRTSHLIEIGSISIRLAFCLVQKYTSTYCNHLALKVKDHFRPLK